MDLRFSDEDEAFRAEVRDWLETNLSGDFAEARGLGGPGREENEGFDVRLAGTAAKVIRRGELIARVHD